MSSIVRRYFSHKAVCSGIRTIGTKLDDRRALECDNSVCQGFNSKLQALVNIDATLNVLKSLVSRRQTTIQAVNFVDLYGSLRRTRE